MQELHFVWGLRAPLKIIKTFSILQKLAQFNLIQKPCKSAQKSIVVHLIPYLDWAAMLFCGSVNI